MEKSRKSGQVVLIVLLVVVVVLTIGLSLISQSVTDISISKDEQEAIRAFSAAEAGIESALQNIALGFSTVDVDGITANVRVSNQNNNLDFDLNEGEYLDLNLQGAAVGTLIRLTISSGSGLETTFYKNNNKVDRYLYNYNSSACLSGNEITTANGGIINLRSVTSNDLILRVRAICQAVSVNVTVVSGSLPVQAQEIDSRASQEGKTSAIQVTRADELPSIFDYVVFSKGQITHSEY